MFVGAPTALHALLWRRDPRAAAGWISVCLLLPGAGAALYWILGVNRVRTHGRRVHGVRTPVAVAAADGHRPAALDGLVRLADRVTRRPLVAGNRVVALHGGEDAYPAMLAAIGDARESVRLCSFIFDVDDVGRTFVEALAAAAARGAQVQVLLDAVGEKYSRGRATQELRRHGVTVARFLPPSLLHPNLRLNLRNHRKLLVVDGRVGFTGGMNVGARHMAARTADERRVVDIHFRVEGPVVAQMEDAFREDWAFATGAPLAAPPARAFDSADGAWCRAVTDGPNEDFEVVTWILRGAFAAARSRVLVMTPYFIPDRALIAAMSAAALRGVRVDLVLPGRNNHLLVHWACRAMLWELLERGVRAWYQPAPFVHTKLLVVDDEYALVGSANLDPRSLRLNFEFDLEVYDDEFVAGLVRHFDAARTASREILLAELDGRPFGQRVRDGIAKLVSPFL